jgi:hypothetical protein
VLELFFEGLRDHASTSDSATWFPAPGRFQTDPADRILNRPHTARDPVAPSGAASSSGGSPATTPIPHLRPVISPRAPSGTGTIFTQGAGRSYHPFGEVAREGEMR